jgi:hypothetical protein
VKLGHHHFGRGPFLFLDFVDRNSTPVIDDGDGVVEMDSYFNCIAITSERLVN